MKKINLIFTIVTVIFLLQNILLAQPNFVTNGDFSAGNSGFTSMYAYCNTAGCMGACGCPPQYAVGSSANYYHSFLTGFDHTTGTGNFLIADAATSPNVTVWKEVIPVSTNTNYNFSYWLCSVYPTPPANMKVVINGADVGTPVIAPTVVNTWIQKSVLWNSGGSTSATIELVDLSTVFVGNDFGLDDISLTASCNSVSPFICSVTPNLNAINVTKSSNILVKFTNAMNASTINSSNIKVFGLQTGLMSSVITYDLGSKTAVINPNNDFKVGEKIQVTLSAAIKTASNTPITPFTWTFTVQALGGSGVFTQASVIYSVADVNQYNSGELLKSVDIDGDGDIDLVAENYYSSSINIFKNNGTGAFSSSQIIANIPDVHWYSALNLADYDNDGDIDMSFSTATPIFGIDSFYVYKNDGTGHFTKFSSMVGGGLIASAADLDGDGDMDLAESWGFDKIRYFINDGNGNFTMHQIDNLGYYHTNGCDVGDIDNDGDIDILVSIKDFSGSNCKVVMLMNDGNANFTTGNSYLTNNYFSNQIFSDLNGDNKLDFVGWNYQYFNQGNSTFSQAYFAVGSEALPFDFDGDGDLDLAYTTGQFGGLDNLVKYYKNDGAGSFSNSSVVEVGHNTNSMTSGDFDGDGDLDMAADNSLGHIGNRSDISILLNNNNCVNPLTANICEVIPNLNAINVTKSSNILVKFTNAMNASTINGSNIKVFGLQTGLMSSVITYDPVVKTAVINPNNDFKVGEKIQVSLSSGIKTSSNTPIDPFTWNFTVQALGGTGEFREASIINEVNTNPSQPGVVTKSGDIDGDGDLDLITIGYFTGIKIYKNNGSGIFTKVQEIKNLPNVEHYAEFYTGDFDGDGDLDFALTVATPTFLLTEIYTYKNDGSGHFTKTNSSVGGGLIGIAADLDGDGDLDIAMSFGLDRMRYEINDGNGNFTLHEIQNLGYYHSSGCDIGDVDNDGDMDIVVSIKDFDDTHSKAIVFLNDGHANFTQGNTYFTNTYMDDEKFTDINGDRNLDFVSRNYHHTGSGNGMFTQTPFPYPGSQAMPFDFNGDGDIDIVYSGYPSNKVYPYSNNGSGVFTPVPPVTLGNYTTAGATGDFDGDGDIDFTINNVYGHSGYSDISIMKNGNRRIINLNITSAIEGLYNPSQNQLNTRDLVTAYLRNASSPYGIVDSATVAMDSLTFTGNFVFENASSGTYYIVLKHRNALETWSKSGGENLTEDGTSDYDFTSSRSQCYGNNLILVGSKYCICSGDVNHDGVIDLSDLLSTFNDAQNFASGLLDTDLNGDNLVDLTDITINYNNAINFVNISRP